MEEAGLKQILRKKEDLDRWSLVGQGWGKEASVWVLIMFLLHSAS